jgi:hypothetical protein
METSTNESSPLRYNLFLSELLVLLFLYYFQNSAYIRRWYFLIFLRPEFCVRLSSTLFLITSHFSLFFFVMSLVNKVFATWLKNNIYVNSDMLISDLYLESFHRATVWKEK